MKLGYPHELPRHGGPPRGYVPVARGALATSMSHDLLSAGFARPSEGAFRCARTFLWKSKSRSERAFAFALRRSELAREPRSHWIIPLRASASAVRDGAASRVRGNDGVGLGVFRMTQDSPPTQDSPLSRLRERAGERALFAEPQPLPQPRRKSVGRITPTALSAESRTESAPTVPGKHGRRSGLRPRLDSPATPDAPVARTAPLPPEEGRGEGANPALRTFPKPKNHLTEQHHRSARAHFTITPLQPQAQTQAEKRSDAGKGEDRTEAPGSGDGAGHRPGDA
ncbi:hypothetical protein SAMN05216577_13012 [Pseudomonas citronellolis]|uniref:Uncharacterized protein n=1 Tax=Pseudomonas citronellolis TaxID=53408 RepID=A0AAQ1KJV8_9PSED|nr:hypothetical protein SAMN05216577_13012 [Pseudomonas citronellolis]